MNFKSKFKLEFDIERIQKIWKRSYTLSLTISEVMNFKNKDKTKITCSAKIEKIEVDKHVDPKARAETVSHH